MKRILVQVDDRHLPLLAKSGNQSKLVRYGLDLILSDKSSPVTNDILRWEKAIYKLLKEMDSKLDYMASRLK